MSGVIELEFAVRSTLSSQPSALTTATEQTCRSISQLRARQLMGVSRLSPTLLLRVGPGHDFRTTFC